MTTAVPVRIANAVASALNSARINDDFTTTGWVAARRYFDWSPDYSDLDGLAVDVLFRTTNPPDGIDLSSYSALQYQVGVDVVVRKRFEPSDREDDGRLKNSAVDPLVFLVQEFFEWFVARRNSGENLVAEPEANWRGVDVLVWCNQAMLRESIFEGVVRINFDLMRTV